MKLGAITVFSGKDITCNGVVKAANVSDAAGNSFPIEQTANNDANTNIVRANGSQSMHPSFVLIFLSQTRRIVEQRNCDRDYDLIFLNLFYSIFEK